MVTTELDCITNKKTISVGLVLTNNKELLICHSTGNDFYDLPKGSQEENESPIETCLREVKEETDLLIDSKKLKDLGIFNYTKYKDLHLFLLVDDKLPKLESMKCTSYFISPNSGKIKPEIDGYKYIPIYDVEQYMTKRMAKVLKNVFQI